MKTRTWRGNLLLACSLAVVFTLGSILQYTQAQPLIWVGTLLILFACVFVFSGMILLAARRAGRARVPLTIALVVIDVIACVSVSISICADGELFYPNQNQGAYDTLVGNPIMEQVTAHHGRDTYTGWFVHNSDGKAPLVISFGGNEECAASRIAGDEKSGRLSVYSGYNFMMLDYPGYGTSPGSPSQSSMFSMAEAAYDYAVTRPDVDTTRIVIEGYSMGTGMATYLASQRDIAGLILIAPYDSGLSLYNSRLNIFHGPLRWLVGFRADSMAYAQSVQVAPLIVTSTADEVIGYTQSENLGRYFPKSPQLTVFPAIPHTQYLATPQVLDLIRAYLQQVNQ
ncbi:MAG: alpha/beta hydrolase [Propionibacteriaceae bacterium]|nr:alpha/beta hydrolase [Propionibacteriaceae bacterium]